MKGKYRVLAVFKMAKIIPLYKKKVSNKRHVTWCPPRIYIRSNSFIYVNNINQADSGCTFTKLAGEGMGKGRGKELQIGRN